MGVLTPLAIRIGGISWMPRFLPQIVWIDRLIQRLTRGRFTLLDIAGLPSAMLTVPGRKTGQPRSTPLLCIPYGSSYLIAGSYFGGPKEPMWVANLEAADGATLRFKGRTMPMNARPVGPDERPAVWAHLLKTWPNFAKYEERTDRKIKVFQLTPSV
jgi:deazaflavin-dependent oxidoreductase (nitroreductase family)